jgi:hypothetical protein
MRYPVLIILASLLLILPAAAYTVPQIQVVYGCSADHAASAPGYGLISVTSTPTNAYLKLDGKDWTDPFLPGMGCVPGFGGGQTCLPHFVIATPDIANASVGKHTLTTSLSGYYPDTSSVTVCDQKVTYVTLNLVAIPTTVPTTAAPVRAGITFAQATTTIVTGITTAVPTTTVTMVPGVTTQVTQQVTQQATATAGAGSTAQPDTLGSLSITTTPAGAFIFIDGVQRGVTPATIPGISAGTHTLLLKLDGYQDISTPVTIAAGKTQDYSSGMAKNAAAAPAAIETTNATATPKKAPGFAAVLGITALGTILCIRKQKK